MKIYQFGTAPKAKAAGYEMVGTIHSTVEALTAGHARLDLREPGAGVLTMMGSQGGAQDRLFYSFNLEDHAPKDHQTTCYEASTASST